MPIVAEHYEIVIGVDTHAATHTLAAVIAGTGATTGKQVVEATDAGLDRAMQWISGITAGRQVLIVIEGIGSYGARLADKLTAVALPVVEPSLISTSTHRGVGKTDALDSVRIARSVLPVDTAWLRQPRTGSERIALRVLVIAREQMTTDRTRSINALTALVRTIDLGIDARTTLTSTQVKCISAWRSRVGQDVGLATCRAEAVRLAHHVRDLDQQLTENRARLSELTTTMVPELLGLTGVGAVVAATVLIAWSHPGRVRNEAAFASLAGACPIPASSGNTHRYRLNRGGDRQLNRALNTIVLTRMRTDEDTRAYVARRRAQGRTTKEIMRCLKRYVARQLFRSLAASPPTYRTATTPAPNAA